LVADIGCGHGLVAALLAAGRADRTVVGVDPDPRKISLARLGPGRLSNVSFLPGTVDALLSDLQGKLDGVVVVDVLYLIPPEKWPTFLESCHRLLKPGGELLLKEAEATRSWKTWKCLAQEQLMVRILRRTRSSGSVHLITREEAKGLLRDRGFEKIEVIDLSKGYSTPHVLFTAKRRLR
jgi:2-polyprenyl-6-hydroxyphenyl methylase/3-demethylubiquinone-9 3-methyltransferase